MGTEGTGTSVPTKSKRGQVPPSPTDEIDDAIVITKDSKTLKRLNILNSK